ncbi:hypothetical protein MIR68_003662 [Amoeboaphelidium protococcarum]|nr:hypothetical protein MIR68_003662 [Amoeboaphelidium protococcarum]
MDGLLQLALLPDTIFAQCLSPVDLLELSLTCRDVQKFVQSRKTRYFIRRVYFSYYGPGLTVVRITQHAYLGIRVAKEILYFLSPQATQSKAFARLFKYYQSNDFAKCSNLFRKLGELIIDHLGEEYLSSVKSTYYYHEAVDDEILCMSDKAYVTNYSLQFMCGIKKGVVSVQNPRWKVLEYRYFKEMLSKHNCHALYFHQDQWCTQQREIIRFEQFFGTRMSEADLSRFLFKFLIYTGQHLMHDIEDDLSTCLEDLCELQYYVKPIMDIQIIKFVRLLLDCNGEDPQLSFGDKFLSAYEYLMYDHYYEFDVATRLDISNLLYNDGNFDKSGRVELSEYIKVNLPESSAARLCGPLNHFARKFPLNGERAAIILAFLGHWKQLDQSCNLYFILMTEAYDKPDDDEFCLLLYKLIRFCHIKKYEGLWRMIYYMFGDKPGYQQKLLATVEKHIEPDNLWIFMGTIVSLCGPLELESASRIFAKVLKSSSIDYRVLKSLPDNQSSILEQDTSVYIDELYLELKSIAQWLGVKSVVHHCLTHLDSDLSKEYEMDILQQCVGEICQYSPYKQRCEMAASIAHHYLECPAIVARFLSKIVHNDHFSAAISLLEKVGTQEQLKLICKILSTDQFFKKGYAYHQLLYNEIQLTDGASQKLFGFVLSD